MVISRNFLANAGTGILVLCALVVTGLSVHQYIALRNAAEGVPREIGDWSRLTQDRHAALGSDAASVKIVEFADYQCPFCKQLEASLQALVNHSHGKVAVIRYDLPIPSLHPQAYGAAVASRCAGSQGAHEAFESALFASDLSRPDWIALASEGRVPDVRRFEACLNAMEAKTLVDADMKVAEENGIKETPTLVIDGKIYAGMQSEDALAKLVYVAR